MNPCCLKSGLCQDLLYILSFFLPLLLHMIPISQFSAPREKGHLNVEHSHSNGHFSDFKQGLPKYIYIEMSRCFFIQNSYSSMYNESFHRDNDRDNYSIENTIFLVFFSLFNDFSQNMIC